MSATALMAALLSRGYTLADEGGSLRVKPSAGLTDTDLAGLREHKSEILAILSAERFCPWCDEPVRFKAISAVSGKPLYWCYTEDCGWVGTWPREGAEVS